MGWREESCLFNKVQNFLFSEKAEISVKDEKTPWSLINNYLLKELGSFTGAVGIYN